MKLWRLSGIFILATAVIHTVFAFVFGWTVMVDIAREGVFNTVPPHMDREAFLWFFIAGFILFMFGLVCHWIIKTSNKPLPAFIGWWMLVLMIIIAVLEPASGWCLFLPTALIIIIADRKYATG